MQYSDGDGQTDGQKCVKYNIDYLVLSNSSRFCLKGIQNITIQYISENQMLPHISLEYEFLK